MPAAQSFTENQGSELSPEFPFLARGGWTPHANHSKPPFANRIGKILGRR
jgi:hypothetical protein